MSRKRERMKKSPGWLTLLLFIHDERSNHQPTRPSWWVKLHFLPLGKKKMNWSRWPKKMCSSRPLSFVFSFLLPAAVLQRIKYVPFNPGFVSLGLIDESFVGRLQLWHWLLQMFVDFNSAVVYFPKSSVLFCQVLKFMPNCVSYDGRKIRAKSSIKRQSKKNLFESRKMHMQNVTGNETFDKCSFSAFFRWD